MEKEFVPYEQALALKELGFDEPCLGYFKQEKVSQASWEYLESQEKVDYIFGTKKNTILAPTFSQAFRWLYQKLDIEKGVMPLDTESQQLLLKELIEFVKENGKINI